MPEREWGVREMEAPVACSRCGKCIELEESNFDTQFCNCRNEHRGGCSHGICDECLREITEE